MFFSKSVAFISRDEAINLMRKKYNLPIEDCGQIIEAIAEKWHNPKVQYQGLKNEIVDAVVSLFRNKYRLSFEQGKAVIEKPVDNWIQIMSINSLGIDD